MFKKHDNSEFVLILKKIVCEQCSQIFVSCKNWTNYLEASSFIYFKVQNLLTFNSLSYLKAPEINRKPPSFMCKKKNNLKKQRESWTETLNVVCKSLIAWFDCLFTRELHLRLFVGILDLSLKVLLTFCQYFHGLLNIWLHICQYRQIHLLTIQLLCILVECTIFHETKIYYFMSKRHTRKSPKFVTNLKPNYF